MAVTFEHDITCGGCFCPKCGNEFEPAFSNGYCTDCGADVENYEAGVEYDEADVEAYLASIQKDFDDWVDKTSLDSWANVIENIEHTGVQNR